jgi:ribonuclease HI
VVYDERGEEVSTVSRRIGRATNNEAEYQAAIAGLEEARALGGGGLDLRMDSELVIRQLNGQYKVRNVRLRPFYLQIVDLLGEFWPVTIEHVPRAQNKRADALANLALDTPQGRVR